MMKKTIFFLIQWLIVVSTLFAKQSLDNAISKASNELVGIYSQKSILVIDDFKSPTSNMTDYIRDEFKDYFFKLGIKVVTREEIDIILKEQYFQHNSGMVDEKSIISAAKLKGANSIVFGEFEEFRDAYRIRLRMVDVKTGEYLFMGKYDFSPDKKTELLLGRYSKISIGLGGELNKNSIDSIAYALQVSFDYNVFGNISLGIKMLGNCDIYEKDIILEPLGFLRVYLGSSLNDPVTGIFIEGLGGASIFLNDSAARVVVANAGVGLGYRFSFDNFYFEPSIRAGYPYIFGVCLSMGLRF